MRIAIRHKTRYEFAQPPMHGLQRLRLKPKPTHGQHVLEWNMDFDGACHEAEYDDHHHNRTNLVSIEPGASAISVVCSGTVATSDNTGIIGQHMGHMPLWCFVRQTELTRPGPRMRSLVSDLRGGGDDPLEQLHELSRAVLSAVRYTVGSTDASTAAEEALTAAQGVCQDHAHIFIGGARLLGIPARYVSGYLVLNDRVEQEAGHAWAEAHLPRLGWVGFDVSNGISPDERYVRVATGCDYREAAPVTGVMIGGGEASLKVDLAVEQQSSEQ